jgi:pimeloyl-ACP methyl ester carboxylesterase
MYPQDSQGVPVEIYGSKAKYWVYNDSASPTVMVIHGYRGTHHGLMDVIERLPQLRFIVPDLPGFGESTPMTAQPHDMPGYAKFILELMKQLNLDSVILMGHSMGTLVAAELVVLQPELFTKLILINPIAEDPMRGLGKFKLSPGIIYQWIGGRLMPDRLGHAMLRHPWFILIGSVAMAKTKDPTLRKRIHAIHSNYMVRFDNRGTLLEAYDASLKKNILSNAAKITIPTLLIAGKNDAIAPIGSQRRLKVAVPQAQLVELDNVGHLIHYEQPSEAAEAIDAFVHQADSALA